jgi:hypothetical protein
MSPRQALASALHLFVVLIFFIVALGCTLIPYLPLTREAIIDFLNHRYEECFQIGMGLFALSLVLFIGFFALNRGKCLVIQMGVSTDVRLVQHVVEEYFSTHFHKKIALKEVTLGPKSSLSFLITTHEKEPESLFGEVETGLSLLLRKRFKYTKPFHLIVKN